MNRNEDTQETHGLKSLNCSPKIKEMVQSAKDLWGLVSKLQFWKIKSNFQKQLSKDMRVINRWSKVLVFAVKKLNKKIYIKN